MNRLVPIVEAQFVTPMTNTTNSGTKTTGTINPGIIYVGKTYQVGVEAIAPIKRDSGGNVGVVSNCTCISTICSQTASAVRSSRPA